MEGEAKWRRLLCKAGIGWPWDRHAFYALLTFAGGVYILTAGRWYGIFALLVGIGLGAIAFAQFGIRDR
jgi:hypothetical protein